MSRGSSGRGSCSTLTNVSDDRISCSEQTESPRVLATRVMSLSLVTSTAGVSGQSRLQAAASANRAASTLPRFLRTWASSNVFGSSSVVFGVPTVTSQRSLPKAIPPTGSPCPVQVVRYLAGAHGLPPGLCVLGTPQSPEAHRPRLGGPPARTAPARRSRTIGAPVRS